MDGTRAYTTRINLLNWELVMYDLESGASNVVLNSPGVKMAGIILVIQR